MCTLLRVQVLVEELPGASLGPPLLGVSPPVFLPALLRAPGAATGWQGSEVPCPGWLEGEQWAPCLASPTADPFLLPPPCIHYQLPVRKLLFSNCQR